MPARCYLSFGASFLLFFLASVGHADWKREWEEAVQGAEKEGRLTLYAGAPFIGYNSIIEAFEKSYPKIKVDLVGGRGSQVGPRLIAERRAGKYLADLFVGGKGTAFATLYVGKALDPIKPLLILPEIEDQSRWWEGKHWYLDPESQYIFVFAGNPGASSVAYNTNLVQKKEITSYRNLINPKWKGKIVAYDPREPAQGTVLLFFYHHPDLGPDFIKRLYGEMGVTISRDFRQPTDWLGLGKFPLCVPCANVQGAIDQGLPVAHADDLKEGATMSSKGHTVSFLNKAPHPRAARVFVNWLLSREGQTLVQRVKEVSFQNRPNSLRNDIPKNDVPPIHQRVEGMTYFFGEDARFSDSRPVDRLLSTILGR